MHQPPKKCPVNDVGTRVFLRHREAGMRQLARALGVLPVLRTNGAGTFGGRIPVSEERGNLIETAGCPLSGGIGVFNTIP